MSNSSYACVRLVTHRSWERIGQTVATVQRTQWPRNRVSSSGLNKRLFSCIERHTGSSHCATRGVSTRQICQGLNFISYLHPLPSFRMCRSLSSTPYTLLWRQKDQISFTIWRMIEYLIIISCDNLLAVFLKIFIWMNIRDDFLPVINKNLLSNFNIPLL